MHIICHHIESTENDDEPAACGFTGWQYATTGWSGVDCPNCLSAQQGVKGTACTHPKLYDYGVTIECAVCGEVISRRPLR